jgi:hypothetical protein
LPPAGGTEELALLNPGHAPVRVTISPFDESGPAGAKSTVTVPAGRTVTVSLSFFGSGPLSATVTAADGTIVVGIASQAADGSGFAATTGVPRDEQSGSG